MDPWIQRWQSEIERLKSLIEHVTRHQLRLEEDVGCGWVDITKRKLSGWRSKIDFFQRRIDTEQNLARA